MGPFDLSFGGGKHFARKRTGKVSTEQGWKVAPPKMGDLTSCSVAVSHPSAVSPGFRKWRIQSQKPRHAELKSSQWNKKLTGCSQVVLQTSQELTYLGHHIQTEVSSIWTMFMGLRQSSTLTIAHSGPNTSFQSTYKIYFCYKWKNTTGHLT